MKPQSYTPGAISSGNASAAARASGRGAVPMDAVGQATSAISARWRAAASPGWAKTNDAPRSVSANVAGATSRHFAQSMHESSTKNGPGTFSGSLRAATATPHRSKRRRSR